MSKTFILRLFLYLAIGDHRFWNESASNPNFNYHGHSSTNSRIGPSPFYNSSPTCDDLYKMRRYSGNILTRSTDNQVNVYVSKLMFYGKNYILNGFFSNFNYYS